MTIGIMQPYFFPYLGYFQLINAVDKFVIYDNIEYTRKGWINRNRILMGNEPYLLSLPIRNDSDYLNIDQRFLAETWPRELEKMLARIRNSYSKAPQFRAAFPVVETCLRYKEQNLFYFLRHSIQQVVNYLGINTPLVASSTITSTNTLKKSEKIFGLCGALGAHRYINPIGGMDLYQKEDFSGHNIELHFHKMEAISYPQFGASFVPSLSIIDVMMFNSREEIHQLLQQYTLL